MSRRSLNECCLHLSLYGSTAKRRLPPGLGPISGAIFLNEGLKLEDLSPLLATVDLLRAEPTPAQQRRNHPRPPPATRPLTRGSCDADAPKTKTLQGEHVALLTNAITTWNTIYTEAATQHLTETGTKIARHHLAHLSPAIHEHVNLYGKYDFTNPTPPPPDQLRPLNLNPPIDPLGGCLAGVCVFGVVVFGGWLAAGGGWGVLSGSGLTVGGILGVCRDVSGCGSGAVGSEVGLCGCGGGGQASWGRLRRLARAVW